MKDITLKELVKLNPDYINIRFNEDQWEIYASKEQEVKVFDQIQRLEAEFVVRDTPIGVYPRDTEITPKGFSFSRYDNCDTVKCLLAHKPDSIIIDYWKNNQSEYLKKNGISVETITVKGYKGKTGYYEVKLNKARSETDFNRFALIAY